MQDYSFAFYWMFYRAISAWLCMPVAGSLLAFDSIKAVKLDLCHLWTASITFDNRRIQNPIKAINDLHVAMIT